MGKALNTVGSAENKRIENDIAAKAVTVVKNNNNTLPCKLTEKSRVLILSPSASQAKSMLQGWNNAKRSGVVPDSAVIKTRTYSKKNYKVSGKIKSHLNWADVVIITSDVSKNSQLSYKRWHSAGPQNFVKYCAKKDKKSIIISVDKPYDIRLYPASNAVIAVYGDMRSNLSAGIEVALGLRPATGRLPVKVGTYKRGHGINYDALLPLESVKPELTDNKTEDYQILENLITFNGI